MVLIVDDDEGLVFLIEESLSRAGLACFTATSGQEALAWLAERTPDLLLIDLRLPDMSGSELIARQKEREKALPFVVITGQGDERVAVEMMKQGALDYLIKDSRLLDLLPSIAQRLLREIDQERRAAAAEAEGVQLSFDLQEERRRLANLLSSVPAIVWEEYGEPGQTGPAGFASAYVEKMLGYTVEEWRAKPGFWLSAVHPDDRELALREAAAIFERGKGGSLRFRWIAKSGRVVWAEAQMVVICDADGRPAGARGVTVDITERRWNEVRRNLQFTVSRALADAAALREAAPRVLQALCESLEWSLGELWLVDPDGRVIRRHSEWHDPSIVRDGFEMVTRVNAFPKGGNLPGQVWESGKPVWVNDLGARTRAPVQQGLRSAFCYPISLGRRVLGAFIFYARAVEESPTHEVLQIFSAVGGLIAQCIERKGAEDDRKRLESEIVDATASEQRRLGQDLHDDLCQLLAGNEMLSSALARTLEKDSPANAPLARQIAEVMRQGLERARLLARGMSPVVFDSAGLPGALRDLALHAEEMFQIRCSYDCPDPVEVRDEVAALHLYRIAQEAIHNAVRHGKAREVGIRLQSNDDGCSLLISDNGGGIPQPLPRTHGMGLRTMSYRAGMVGGTLEVRRGAGGGAEIVCTFPKEL